MVNKINNITDKYILNEIYKIIDKNNDNYTINSNGIFINIDNLNEEILIEINNFLNYTDYTNKLLNNTKIKKIEKKVESNSNQIIINNNNNNNNNNNIQSNIDIKSTNENKLILNYPYDVLIKKCKKDMD